MFQKTKWFLFILIFCAGSAFAADKIRSIDAILTDIQQEQGIKDTTKIDPGKVSGKLLEELGDSAMEIMAGSSARHELMDKMMGGEGSASLALFHQRLGYQYLSGAGLGLMGMMGTGMMGYPFLGRNRNLGGYMMGGYGPGMMGWFGWGGMLMGLIFLIILALIIVLAVRAARGSNFGGAEIPVADRSSITSTFLPFTNLS